MRDMHEHGQYDGGRYAHASPSYVRGDDPLPLLIRMAALLSSPDPEDRRDAYQIAYNIAQYVYCPDGVWVARTEYLPDKDGKRWADHHVIWSAHLTQEEGERWHKWWTEHWARKRTDYGMLPLIQMNRVHIQYLRHPSVPAGFVVSV